MKKILVFFVSVMIAQFSQSQALKYVDLAQLFSRDDFNGSARFEALGGAFGALGGDIGSMTINPAGLSVFNRNKGTVSFQSRSNDISTLYANTNRFNQEEFFNISQAGAVLVFDSFYSTGEWSNFTLGINYRIRGDLNETFFAEGNGNIATFTEFPLDPNATPIAYTNPENQEFSNFLDGEITEINVGFSAIHNNKLHIGISANLVSLSFSQQAILRERNNDGNGNILNARFYQENISTGNGFGITAGVIYKPTQAFRLGISYQSPTWFTEIIEDTNITNNDGFFGDTEISVSNDNVIYDNTIGVLPFQSLLYRLRTPGRVTLSSAIVFGKFGLISADYSSRNYQTLNLSGDNFSNENLYFDTNFRRTNNFNIGTEWRFGRLSLRGGYRFEQSPNVNQSINSQVGSPNNLQSYFLGDLQSHSLGIGYNFGNFRIDVSYVDSNRTAANNFYSDFTGGQPAQLDIDNRIISTTLVLNF